ncbi:PLP-dependent aminotransferase family protein, partial [Kitasatospora sp. NPDC001574]
AVLSGALAQDLPDWVPVRIPAGGLHLWLRLPEPLADGAVAVAARVAGVAVNAGRRYFPAEPPAAHLRLGFAAAADQADLVEAVRRLAAAVVR